jgi:hypothetical protein
MSRRMLHVLIALILLGCAVSPFVESALNCHDNIFSTGYDGESTLAVVVLLLELAVSLAGLLVLLCENTELKGRIVEKCERLTFDWDFRFTIPDASPPVPLRI